MLLPERSIPYKTFVKTALVLALREQFKNYPDASLRRTKVSVDYPNTTNLYPTVIVRFFERTVSNIGIGHVEFLTVNDTDNLVAPFKHFIYNGDIEFAILALSSKDRDLISDALVSILAMSDPSEPSDFFNRIYSPLFDFDPGDAVDPFRYNFINLNTDQILGFGETQNPAPWLTEDQLQYQSSYRVGVMGEFYSLPPGIAAPSGPLLHVNLLPYMQDLESVPTGRAAESGYAPPDSSIVIPPVTSTESDPAPWT